MHKGIAQRMILHEIFLRYTMPSKHFNGIQLYYPTNGRIGRADKSLDGVADCRPHSATQYPCDRPGRA